MQNMYSIDDGTRGQFAERTITCTKYLFKITVHHARRHARHSMIKYNNRKFNVLDICINKGIGDAGSTADLRMLWSAINCLGLGLL